MRDILALASTGILAAAFLIPMFRPDAKLDPDLKGGILLQWGLVMGWFFGSSKQSQTKDQTISDMAAKQ